MLSRSFTLLRSLPRSIASTPRLLSRSESTKLIYDSSLFRQGHYHFLSDPRILKSNYVDMMETKKFFDDAVKSINMLDQLAKKRILSYAQCITRSDHFLKGLWDGNPVLLVYHLHNISQLFRYIERSDDIIEAKSSSMLSQMESINLNFLLKYLCKMIDEKLDEEIYGSFKLVLQVLAKVRMLQNITNRDVYRELYNPEQARTLSKEIKQLCEKFEQLNNSDLEKYQVLESIYAVADSNIFYGHGFSSVEDIKEFVSLRSGRSDIRMGACKKYARWKL